MKPLKIDLYTDIVCPWCFIGLHRLDKVLAERFPDLAVDIEHHPVILMPDCPPEGLKIDDLLRGRPGAADRLPRLKAEADASGLAVDFSRQAFTYPTIGAHTLIRLARSRGTQHALVAAFVSAHFRDALNVSDPDVLADIAASDGFDRAEAKRLSQDPTEQAKTQSEAAHSRVQGVSTVPHFVFAGISVQGGRQEADLATAIQRALSTHI